MNSTPDTARWLADGPMFKLEWEGLTTATHNVLFIGGEDPIQSALLLLMPHLTRPIVRVGPGETFRPAPGQCSTLILDDVGTLLPAEQVALRQWLDARQERIRVVSTNTTALYPRVASGRFDEGLYYRLNVILFQFEADEGGCASDRAPQGMESPAQ